MKTLQSISDKAAIGLSFLCTLHCLALPIFLTLLPSIAALHLDDERFHLWMLLAVVPLSLFALTAGYRRHQSYRLLLLGGFGLVMMVSAVLWGHEWFGEFGEKGLTLTGALLLAWGHFNNYRLCRQLDCQCHDHQDD